MFFVKSSSLVDEEILHCGPPWVWSYLSDVHVAKDRFWFGDDYVPFVSSVRGIHDDVLEVVGIGTVKLQTKASPSETGPDSESSLQLKHVLHVPDIYCNIIGGPALGDYDVKFRVPQDTSGFWATIINAVDGYPVAYLRPVAENVAVL